jgi:hypothetical protein
MMAGGTSMSARWRESLAAIVLATAALVVAPVGAQGDIDGVVIPPRTPVSVRYGPSSAQTLKFWRPLRDVPSPLLIVIDEGGWQQSRTAQSYFLAAHLANRGFAVAMLPNHQHSEPRVQAIAADAAGAIAVLTQQAERRFIRPGKLGIIGIGTGAAPAALIATDVKWLEANEISFDTLKIFVSIDGDGLAIDQSDDLPDRRQKRAFDLAFGSTLATRHDSMAQWHVGRPDAPSALFLMTVSDRRRIADAKHLAELLTKNSTPAETHIISISEADGLRSSLPRMDGPATKLLVHRLRQAFKP